MTRPENDYLTELALHLRLVGMDGEQIGAILEETRDHLDASGQDAAEVFGPASDYAEALADSQGLALPRRPLQLTPADLVGAAVQLMGFTLLLGGTAAMASGGSAAGVDLSPGHLVGLAVVAGGLAWPLWPATRAYLARRASVAIPTLSVLAIVAVVVALTTLWDDPVLITVPASAAILLGAVVIAGFWIRIWRLRDPVRPPTSETSRTDR